MSNSKNNKLDIFKILLILLSISLFAVGGYRQLKDNVLEIDALGLTYIESLSSGVQRVAKLELEDNYDEDLIASLYEIASKLPSPNNSDSTYFKENPEICAIIEEYTNLFFEFKDAVINFRADGNRDLLFASSESHYDLSTSTTRAVSAYVNELSSFVDMLEDVLMVHVFLMGIVLIKILFNTLSELQKNKELSKDMFIDLSTGLYNRTKCQEILKNAVNPDKRRERAILIFDLNDLKKTNDSLGHRAGDSLIACFATQLKDATKIFSYEVFVGRYGGDEFMAYFSSVEEKDIKLYIEELNFLVTNLNETGSKPFKLSFAVGYSITTEDTKTLTMRELFDEADSDMYKNKIAMKEKKRLELKAQGIETDDIKDDRL
ncbi:MAG: GGDEF domain-containing protein [bacterium]